jgi:hypothetical protein
LRNKIEHRFNEALALVTSGHAQASLLNYEWELVSEFGEEESIADALRFPIFLRSLTAYGEEALRQVQRRLPTKAYSYVSDFHSGLDENVRDDQRFQFRLHLIPWLGPKSEADLAVRFVALDELTEDERETLAGLERTGRVIVRERQRQVRTLGGLSPTAIVHEVEREIPFVFNMWHFVAAWKYFDVRPVRGDPHPERTDERYCIYDSVHGDYVYSAAYAQKLIRHLQTTEGFHEIFDKEPVLQTNTLY